MLETLLYADEVRDPVEEIDLLAALEASVRAARPEGTTASTSRPGKGGKVS